MPVGEQSIDTDSFYRRFALRFASDFTVRMSYHLSLGYPITQDIRPAIPWMSFSPLFSSSVLHFSGRFSSSQVHYIDPMNVDSLASAPSHLPPLRRLLNQRYAYLDIAKAATTIGLVYGTVGVFGYRDIHHRLKQLCRYISQRSDLPTINTSRTAGSTVDQ